MADTPETKTLDKRTSARYLRAGRVDEKTHERSLKSLPDLAEKSSPVETSMADEPPARTEDEDGED